jgi:hypothetical protein
MAQLAAEDRGALAQAVPALLRLAERLALS